VPRIEAIPARAARGPAVRRPAVRRPAGILRHAVTSSPRRAASPPTKPGPARRSN